MKLEEVRGIEDFKFLYEIETNPEIIHYYHPNFNKSEKIEFLTYDKLYEEYKNQTDKKIYIVKIGNKRIGTFSVIKNFEYLVKNIKDTAWISLIFEKEYYGHQIIKDSYILFEKLLKSNGYKRIELGVFEFNIRAKKFYEKMGYKEITCLKNFTYYDGKWWADCRHEKEL